MIKNSDLLREVLKSKINNVPTEQLQVLLYQLARNLVRKYYIKANIGWEDIVHDAVIRLIESFYKFNIELSNNPFSYFTQICGNVYLEIIKKKSKEQSKINKLKGFGFNGTIYYEEMDETEMKQLKKKKDRRK